MPKFPLDCPWARGFIMRLSLCNLKGSSTASITTLSAMATRSTRTYKFPDEICAALDSRSTVRFVVRRKAELESRLSAPIVQAASNRAVKISRALLKQMGREDAKFDTEIVMIELLDAKTTVYFCFDIFLEECDEATRLEISNSTQEPVYYLYVTRQHCVARKDSRPQRIVGQLLEDYLRKDKGSRPFFHNALTPSVYVGGVRQEYGTEAVAASSTQEHVKNSAIQQKTLVKDS